VFLSVPDMKKNFKADYVTENQSKFEDDSAGQEGKIKEDSLNNL
jgi:hypothetical protein